MAAYDWTGISKWHKLPNGESVLVRQTCRRGAPSQTGPWLSGAANLALVGSCWGGPDTVIAGKARVSDSVQLHGRTVIYGNASVKGTVALKDTHVGDDASIDGSMLITESQIGGRAVVQGSVGITTSSIFGNALLCGGGGCWHTKIHGYALVDSARLQDCDISGQARLRGVVVDHIARLRLQDVTVRGSLELHCVCDIRGPVSLQGSMVIKDARRLLILPNFGGLSHSAVIYPNGIVHIGCQRHSVKQWLELYAEGRMARFDYAVQGLLARGRAATRRWQNKTAEYLIETAITHVQHFGNPAAKRAVAALSLPWR